MSDDDFTLEKVEALIAETYQNKSYAEINPGKKRRAESELVGVNHSTLKNTNKMHKVLKSKDGKKGGSTNKGNYHFCFKSGHLKSGCKMREAEFDQKIFRSSIHHDPNTNKNMGKVVLWKKVDGELQVYSIEPVKEKEDTWDQSPGSSAPSNIVFSESNSLPVTKVLVMISWDRPSRWMVGNIPERMKTKLLWRIWSTR